MLPPLPVFACPPSAYLFQLFNGTKWEDERETAGALHSEESLQTLQREGRGFAWMSLIPLPQTLPLFIISYRLPPGKGTGPGFPKQQTLPTRD